MYNFTNIFVTGLVIWVSRISMIKACQILQWNQKCQIIKQTEIKAVFCNATGFKTFLK